MARSTISTLLMRLFLFILCTYLSAEEYTIYWSRSHFQQKVISRSNIMETSVEQENVTVEYPNFVPAEKSGNPTQIYSDGTSMEQLFSTNGGNHDSENEIFAWNDGSSEIDLKFLTISPWYGDPCTLNRGLEIPLEAFFIANDSAKRL